MVSPDTNIMNWKNGILLSAVSYALYLVIWLLLDDETSKQLPAMVWSDYVFDFSLCVLFTYIHCFFVFCYLGSCHSGHLIFGLLSMPQDF